MKHRGYEGAQFLLCGGFRRQTGVDRILRRVQFVQVPQHGDVEAIFVAKVIIDGGYISLRLLTDLPDCSGAVAVLRKDLTGRFQETPLCSKGRCFFKFCKHTFPTFVLNVCLNVNG